MNVRKTNKLRMVTTDGYRLSMIDEEIGEQLSLNEGNTYFI